jgi:uncharacterized protein YbjT (DUF2867 family)
MSSTLKVAVAGGTGSVGRHVVEVLQARGHVAVSMSRARGVDIISGRGLAEAVAGADAIIDTSTNPTPDHDETIRFFTTASRNLQQAGNCAGVRHLVVVSIIGADRFKAGYIGAKLTHERAASAGPVPVSILRAAQFHEFVGRVVDWTRKGDTSYVPEMRTQLVAARAVAEALVDLATQGPPAAGSPAPILEIGGPRPDNMLDAARLLVARRGDRLRIEAGNDFFPEVDRALYQSGALLPAPGAILAGPSFAEWLETQRFD